MLTHIKLSVGFCPTDRKKYEHVWDGIVEGLRDQCALFLTDSKDIDIFYSSLRESFFF
jgi:hypothetical protein